MGLTRPARWKSAELRTGVAADGFEVVPELPCAIRTDDSPDPAFDLRNEFLSDREHLAPAFGWLHELCSPVARIMHPDDVTVGFEVLHESAMACFVIWARSARTLTVVPVSSRY